MRRTFLALPAALLLSLLIAGSALATHCGNNSKPDGAGQHVVLVVNPGTGAIISASGLNKNDRLRGGFVDVYLDLDGSQTASAGDCVINDTYIISEHSGGASTGQNDGGLAVVPPVLRGDDPGGSESGVGFAELVGFCPFG